MATIYQYDKISGKEFFKAGIQVINSVNVEFLGKLLDDKSLTVITELSAQTSEVVQFFTSFDDIINWFYFGKGVGTLTISGMLLTNDKGTPGLPILLDEVMRNTRGKMVGVSIGNAAFNCVLTGLSFQMTQDPSPVVSFHLNLGIVGHSLPMQREETTTCEGIIINDTNPTPPTINPTNPKTAIA